MRLSAVQRDTLLTLKELERAGMTSPIPGVDLFSLVNRTRQSEVLAHNFRVSCHTLHRNGIISIYRNRKSLTMAFSLTDTGRELADKVTDRRKQQEPSP